MTPDDVYLLAEVAESSLAFDRGEKLSRYAQSGIPEYWVVNLPDTVIEVYSEPEAGAYKTMRQVKRGETLSLPVGLEARIRVNEILGEGTASK